jgi:hypothetical protein
MRLSKRSENSNAKKFNKIMAHLLPQDLLIWKWHGEDGS